MKQNNEMVDYTITIKGSDGKEQVFQTRNFVFFATEGEDSGLNVVRCLQASFFELIAMYAAIVNEKERIEEKNTLIPALYNAGRQFGNLNEDVITKERK